MPLYTYTCKKCHHKFDHLVGMTRVEEELKCPICGNRDVFRTFSVFGISGTRKAGPSCNTCSGGNCSTCR